MQVLIALRFYATGAFQRVTGDLFGVSVLATCTSFTRFQGQLRNKKDSSCQSQQTWLIPRESFIMLHTFHISLFFFTFHFTFHFHNDQSHALFSTGVSATFTYHPWSWLRSRLIRYVFGSYIWLKFPLVPLSFSPTLTFSCHSLYFPLPESLCPIRPIKVFLVCWNLLFDLF